MVARQVPAGEVPVHLRCTLCRGQIADALMLKCCGHSFCADCVWLVWPPSRVQYLSQGSFSGMGYRPKKFCYFSVEDRRLSAPSA